MRPTVFEIETIHPTEVQEQLSQDEAKDILEDFWAEILHSMKAGESVTVETHAENGKMTVLTLNAYKIEDALDSKPNAAPMPNPTYVFG